MGYNIAVINLGDSEIAQQESLQEQAWQSVVKLLRFTASYTPGKKFGIDEEQMAGAYIARQQAGYYIRSTRCTIWNISPHN